MIDKTLFLELAIYGVPALLLAGFFHLYQRRSNTQNKQILATAIADGANEPSSLHPIVDHSVCLGCATCVEACPEAKKQPVLGIIDQRAVLLEGSNCFGHGACRTACPTGAIQLVFGTEKRGIDIPNVSPDYESNVKGLFIAGELGGMGLIRNAILQGVAATTNIHSRLRSPGKCQAGYDLIIIGAGPAGFAASLRARELGMKALTFDQDSLGGTVYQFPRGKLVMTSPVDLPLIGSINFREVSKETLLEFWQGIARKHKPAIKFKTRVVDVQSSGDSFAVHTSAGDFNSKFVLLTIGRRGTPRKLNVAGEELPKVTYRLIDPEQYRNHHVLVVGGGDSALEAALAIANEPNTCVSLSYRGNSFSRAKKKNRDKILNFVEAKRIDVYLSSTINEIQHEVVNLQTADGEKILQNDSVLINAGGILPTQFLESIGIESETKYGTI